VKIFYISRKRAKELEPLQMLSKYVNLNLWHIDIASGNIFCKIKKIILAFQKALKCKPDVVLSESTGLPSLIALLASWIGGSKLAVRVKGDLYQEYKDNKHAPLLRHKFYSYLNYQASKIAFAHCHLILPISNVIKTSLIAHGIHKDMHIVYIPIKNSFYEEPAVSSLVNETFVVTVTSFQFHAKIEPLLQAIPPVSRILKSLGMSWYILGDGRYTDSIKNAITASACTDVIKLTGRVNPATYYRHARAHLYFSGMDALPNALLESFFFQLPVLINDDLPAKDIAVNGYNVMTLKNYTDNEVRKSLKRILLDADKRDFLRKNGSLFLSEKCSVDSVGWSLWRALKMLTPDN